MWNLIVAFFLRTKKQKFTCPWTDEWTVPFIRMWPDFLKKEKSKSKLLPFGGASCLVYLSWGSMLAFQAQVAFGASCTRWEEGWSNLSCPGISLRTLNAGKGRACQDWCWKHLSPLLHLSDHELVRAIPLKGFCKLSCSGHILGQCIEKC